MGTVAPSASPVAGTKDTFTGNKMTMKLKSFRFKKVYKKLKDGKKVKLSVKISSSDVTDKKVTWKSSNKK